MPMIRDLGVNFIPGTIHAAGVPPCDNPSGKDHDSAFCPPCSLDEYRPEVEPLEDDKDDQGKGDKGKGYGNGGGLSTHAIAQLRQQMQGRINASF